MSTLTVVQEYSAWDQDAKNDLTLDEFYVLPRIGKFYTVSVDPKEKFKKRRDGRMTYWTLHVDFPTGSYAYSEKIGMEIENLPAMGNEVLLMGKVVASQFRVLMDKYQDKPEIILKFKRTTCRTCYMKLMSK